MENKNTIICGDCYEIMQQLDDNSIACCFRQIQMNIWAHPAMTKQFNGH